MSAIPGVQTIFLWVEHLSDGRVRMHALREDGVRLPVSTPPTTSVDTAHQAIVLILRDGIGLRHCPGGYLLERVLNPRTNAAFQVAMRACEQAATERLSPSFPSAGPAPAAGESSRLV